MQKTIRCILPALFFYLGAYSQNGEIQGVVKDTAENRYLANASVSVIRLSDSILVTYTRTGSQGYFQIDRLPLDRYFILITYPKMADYLEVLNLTNSRVQNLGILMMTPQSTLLKEVIVRLNIAMRIKGDTLEYKADSFKLHQGANVQDLLKKLPGITVDRNGQITAQGQKVEKVLVDGEEFFSDDPAVVTQNLRADAVDKVQSYDKKSDQAEFTGVDDGSRTKTLNLVLKEDKKKGYFGKLSAAGGTDQRISNEAMLNFFRGKKKFSVYGILSNTGKTGLDWQDRNKFGSGGNWGDADIEMGAGFILINNSGDEDFSDFDNQYSGEGIPKTWKAGAHFSNRWSQDADHVNINYSINGLSNDATGNSLTRYTIRDTVNNRDSAYYSRENHHVITNQRRQLFMGIYDLRLDSLASVRFRLNGALEHTDNALETLSGVDEGNQFAINRNRRRNSSVSDKQAFMASVLYKQKFRKKGRTLSVTLSHKYTDNQQSGYLYSETDYFDRQGSIFNRDSIDQNKQLYSQGLTSNARLVYTEPVGKNSMLEYNYTLNRNASSSDRKSFDKMNGKYSVLNQLYSNNYTLLYLLNSTGLKYQYSNRKLTANIGANIGQAGYSQRDSQGVQIRHYVYTNIFPNARINYKLGAQRAINFSYNGNNKPPSVNQIQPIYENSDPLNITIGNPNLRQAFSNWFSIFYTDFKTLTGRSIWMNATYSNTLHAIVQNQVTDSSGKRTLQYVNSEGNYNLWWYMSYGIRLKKPDLNISAHSNAGISRYSNFINNLKNASLNRQVTVGLSLNKDKENKFSLNVTGDYTWNHSESSISSQAFSYWSQEYSVAFTYYFTKRFFIDNNLNSSLRQKVDAFDRNNNVNTWNASLTYKMFKNMNGLLSFKVFDLLNQQKGFERNLSANYVTERNYQVLRRYFMLSFTWNFTKNPGPSKK